MAGSAPRVQISRGALERNLAAALRDAPERGVDLRRDACGHGAGLVAEAARGLGVRSALGDGPVEGLALADEAQLLPPERVFGLAGGGEPVMTFSGRVLQTKPLRAGEGVSYGYRHRAAFDTRVALVTGGYAQGVVRALGGAATVRIRGEERPIVGRVAMDVCVVDLGELEVAPGDEAVFFGQGHPASLASWARATGLTELELVAFPGLRCEREVTA